MSVFAITGTLCSGKTLALKLLKRKGAKVFNADKVVHRLYRDKKGIVYKRVSRAFPESVKRGRISRKILRSLVFSHSERLLQLEAMVHPEVIRALTVWVRKAQRKRGIFIAEVPLLFEKELGTLFEASILVWAPRLILSKRIKDKYKFSQKEINHRLSLYLPVVEKRRKADFVINNNGTKQQLKRAVAALWKNLRGST